MGRTESGDFVWGERWELNPRPSVPQTDALPLSYAHHVEMRTQQDSNLRPIA